MTFENVITEISLTLLYGEHLAWPPPGPRRLVETYRSPWPAWDRLPQLSHNIQPDPSC